MLHFTLHDFIQEFGGQNPIYTEKNIDQIPEEAYDGIAALFWADPSVPNAGGKAMMLSVCGQRLRRFHVLFAKNTAEEGKGKHAKQPAESVSGKALEDLFEKIHMYSWEREDNAAGLHAIYREGMPKYYQWKAEGMKEH